MYMGDMPVIFKRSQVPQHISTKPPNAALQRSLSRLCVSKDMNETGVTYTVKLHNLLI